MICVQSLTQASLTVDKGDNCNRLLLLLISLATRVALVNPKGALDREVSNLNMYNETVGRGLPSFPVEDYYFYLYELHSSGDMVIRFQA